MKFFEKDSDGKFKIKDNDLASILMDNYLQEVEKIPAFHLSSWE